jgi:hypothetical protein
LCFFALGGVEGKKKEWRSLWLIETCKVLSILIYFLLKKLPQYIASNIAQKCPYFFGLKNFLSNEGRRKPLEGRTPRTSFDK